MYRLSVASLMLIVIGLPGWSQDKKEVPKAAKAVSFYPLLKGTKWEYELTVLGNTVEVVQEVTEVKKPAKKEDRAISMITSSFNGQTINEEMSQDDKGVYRHAFNNVKLDKPFMAVKFPLKAQSWTEKIVVMEVEIEISNEMKEPEAVTVPAGKYEKAIPVKASFSAMGQDVSITSYFVEGVGIVKQTGNFAGNEISSVLKKFTPGAKDD